MNTKTITNRLKYLEDKSAVSNGHNRKLPPDIEARIKAIVNDEMSPDDPNHPTPWKFWTFEKLMGFIIEEDRKLLECYFLGSKLEKCDVDAANKDFEEIRLQIAKVMDPWIRYLGFDVPNWWNKTLSVDDEIFINLMKKHKPVIRDFPDEIASGL